MAHNPYVPFDPQLIDTDRPRWPVLLLVRGGHRRGAVSCHGAHQLAGYRTGATLANPLAFLRLRRGATEAT
uniref:Uncharacterized protein n=1 Tax=Oryza glumipatula TaxID=40148 RepID=A0A0D9YYV6_9ORYZ